MRLGIGCNTLMRWRHGIKINLYETSRPDIVFEINKKEYAIETEKAIKHHKKLLKEKIETLNKTYGKNWFFVVTDRKIASKYSKIAPTTDKRYVKSGVNKIVKRK